MSWGFWWEGILVGPLWKAVWNYFKKLKMELPCDPPIPLLGIYPKKINTLYHTVLFSSEYLPEILCLLVWGLSFLLTFFLLEIRDFAHNVHTCTTWHIVGTNVYLGSELMSVWMYTYEGVVGLCWVLTYERKKFNIISAAIPLDTIYIWWILKFDSFLHVYFSSWGIFIS